MLDHQAVTLRYSREIGFTDNIVDEYTVDGALISSPTRVVDAAGKRGIGRRIGHVDLGRSRGGECAADGTDKNGQTRGKGGGNPRRRQPLPGRLVQLLSVLPRTVLPTKRDRE